MNVLLMFNPAVERDAVQAASLRLLRLARWLAASPRMSDRDAKMIYAGAVIGNIAIAMGRSFAGGHLSVMYS